MIVTMSCVPFVLIGLLWLVFALLLMEEDINDTLSQQPIAVTVDVTSFSSV